MANRPECGTGHGHGGPCVQVGVCVMPDRPRYLGPIWWPPVHLPPPYECTNCGQPLDVVGEMLYDRPWPSGWRELIYRHTADGAAVCAVPLRPPTAELAGRTTHQRFADLLPIPRYTMPDGEVA